MEVNNLECFRKKVASGQTALGCVISLSDPIVCECAGDCGLDFVWIDAEHGPFSLETIQSHILACRGTQCAPFVRVAQNSAAVLKPVLDLAPAAVIIPMVNSAEEAEAAVAACKYPPQGVRGISVRRANRYGADSLDDYFRHSEKHPMVIIQIEHVDAVRNLDAILKVKGVDSICVGPCDLSASMGCICDMENPELNKVIDEICAKTKAAGQMLGTASGPLARWQERGVDWIATGLDIGLLSAGFRGILKEGGR